MMVRGAIIVVLLATLFYLVKYIQPVAEPMGPGKVATSRPEPTPAGREGEEPGGFNPAVPVPLPDINKGYVFSEKRKYEKEEPVNAVKAPPVELGPDPLDSLIYSGSLIVGDLRRALVIYQELPQEARRLPPGRNPAQAFAQGASRNKQLNQGDRFMGYVLTSVEADRLVFEKEGRKVEKFLYDRNKQRFTAPESSPQEAVSMEAGGVPLQAVAPPEVLAAMMGRPQAKKRPTPRAMTSGPAPEATPPGESGAASGTTASSRMIRRSQRILGLDPSIKVPVTPVPGLPVPNN